MVKTFLTGILITTAFFSLTACNNSEETETSSADTTVMETTAQPHGGSSNYISLSGGSPVHRDEASGRYVDESGAPVEFYVDMNSMDTFYGATNQNVSNALIHENDSWRVDDTKVKIDGDEMKIKSDDGKIKVDGDETKIKTGDTKIKTDGDEYKQKSN